MNKKREESAKLSLYLKVDRYDQPFGRSVMPISLTYTVFLLNHKYIQIMKFFMLKLQKEKQR